MTTGSAGVRAELLRSDDGPPLGPFLRDLLTGTGPGIQFLPSIPQDADAWRAAIATAHTGAAPVPIELAERLAGRQAALGAGSKAEANARRLAAGSTLAIVTGQQPGLLGGPLLTLHKAAGAIALARHLETELGADIVPVYWLASQDHDFDEANRAAVLARDGQVHRVRMDVAATGQSISDIEVPHAGREALLAEVAALLPDTDRAREALELARSADGESFATWSARTLAALLGDSGMVFVEPELLDPYAAATYAWLLDNAETISTAVRKLGAALREAGLPAPLDPEPGTTALFYRHEEGGPRRAVRIAEDGEVLLRGEPAGFDVAELERRLTASPQLGAGNVIGRVFVQNRHLPTLAYVAGPTEIAYQAQLAAACEATAQYFPLALPRPEATWVHRRDHDACAALGLSIGALLRGDDPPVDESAGGLQAAREALDRHLAQLPDETAAIGDGSRSHEALERLRSRLAATADKAWAGVVRAVESDNDVGGARLSRLRAALRPHGKPQERLVSPLSLVARHGLESLQAGLSLLNPLAAAHHVITTGVEDVESDA